MAPRATTKSATLREYRRKRDFSRTSEPKATKRKSGPVLAFVIQKHAASRLHYDLRLELDGVMKSWAVPKGPSLDPSVKRLAVEVEDHPIDYNSFEGTIPKGEYGGGTVMIWDSGVYTYGGDDDEIDPVTELRRGLVAGTLEFVMVGRRMKGGWVLVRTKAKDRAKQWLLIKRHDRYASTTVNLTEKHLKSVVTKRTMEQIARGKG